MNRFTFRFVVFALFTTASLAGIAQEKKKPLSDAEAYIQASLRTAQLDIDEYQKEVDSLQEAAKSRRVRRKRRLGSKAKVLKAIKIYQDNIDSLKASLPTPHILNEYNLKVGAVGQLAMDYEPQVVQVIDKNNVLIGIVKLIKRAPRLVGIVEFSRRLQNSINKKQSFRIQQIIWVEDIDTSGMADRQPIEKTPGVFRVVENKTYQTILGTNTVLVVKKLDLKSIQPHIDKWLAEHKKP